MGLAAAGALERFSAFGPADAFGLGLLLRLGGADLQPVLGMGSDPAVRQQVIDVAGELGETKKNVA